MKMEQAYTATPTGCQQWVLNPSGLATTTFDFVAKSYINGVNPRGSIYFRIRVAGSLPGVLLRDPHR